MQDIDWMGGVMKRNILFGLIVIILLLTIQGCFPAIRLFVYDGTHSGRVVDKDTGEPIEGVVVLGVWTTKIGTVGGAWCEFYDARETVTDEKGSFSVPGQGVMVITNVDVMQCVIFKAGYEYHSFDWDMLEEDLGRIIKIKWEGNKPIIPLKKLTMEERRRQGTPPAPPFDAPFEKVKLYLKERNKDRIDRGLKPLTLWGGVRYE